MTVASLWKALDHAGCGKPVGEEDLLDPHRRTAKVNPWTYNERQRRHQSIEDRPSLAVDLSIWICESLTSTAMNDHNENPALHLVFTRTVRLLSKGIKLVVVVEGKRRIRAKGSDEKQDKFRRRRSGTSFWKACKQCETMLEFLGVPVVKAKAEGEALCALLNQQGIVDGVISNDGDCLLFGAKVVYTKFSIDNLEKGCIMKYEAANLVAIADLSNDDDNEDGNENGQGTGAAAAKEGAKDKSSDDRANTVPLSREDLVAFALLTGSDLAGDGIEKVGYKKALRFIRKCKLNHPLTPHTASMDELRSWARSVRPIVETIGDDDNSPDSAIQDKINATAGDDKEGDEPNKKKKESCCSRCSHPGTKRSHEKHGCSICGTEPGEPCYKLSSDDKFRKSLRAKALALRDPKFDPTLVVNAYMRPNDNQLPAPLLLAGMSSSKKLRMAYPKLREVAAWPTVVKGHSLSASQDYVKQSVARLLARTQLFQDPPSDKTGEAAESGGVSGPVGRNKLPPREQPIPQRITRKLVQNGIGCYEVCWSMQATMTDKNGDGIDGYEFSTVEPQDMVNRQHPQIVDAFNKAPKESKHQVAGELQKRKDFLQQLFQPANQNDKKQSARLEKEKEREKDKRNFNLPVPPKLNADDTSSARRNKLKKQRQSAGGDVEQLLRFTNMPVKSKTSDKTEDFDFSSLESGSLASDEEDEEAEDRPLKDLKEPDPSQVEQSENQSSEREKAATKEVPAPSRSDKQHPAIERSNHSSFKVRPSSNAERRTIGMAPPAHHGDSRRRSQNQKPRHHKDEDVAQDKQTATHRHLASHHEESRLQPRPKHKNDKYSFEARDRQESGRRAPPPLADEKCFQPHRESRHPEGWPVEPPRTQRAASETHRKPSRTQSARTEYQSTRPSEINRRTAFFRHEDAHTARSFVQIEHNVPDDLKKIRHNSRFDEPVSEAFDQAKNGDIQQLRSNRAPSGRDMMQADKGKSRQGGDRNRSHRYQATDGEYYHHNRDERLQRRDFRERARGSHRSAHHDDNGRIGRVTIQQRNQPVARELLERAHFADTRASTIRNTKVKQRHSQDAAQERTARHVLHFPDKRAIEAHNPSSWSHDLELEDSRAITSVSAHEEPRSNIGAGGFRGRRHGHAPQKLGSPDRHSLYNHDVLEPDYFFTGREQQDVFAGNGNFEEEEEEEEDVTQQSEAELDRIASRQHIESYDFDGLAYKEHTTSHAIDNGRRSPFVRTPPSCEPKSKRIRHKTSRLTPRLHDGRVFDSSRLEPNRRDCHALASDNPRYEYELSMKPERRTIRHSKAQSPCRHCGNHGGTTHNVGEWPNDEDDCLSDSQGVERRRHRRQHSFGNENNEAHDEAAITPEGTGIRYEPLLTEEFVDIENENESDETLFMKDAGPTEHRHRFSPERERILRSRYEDDNLLPATYALLQSKCRRRPEMERRRAQKDALREEQLLAVDSTNAEAAHDALDYRFSEGSHSNRRQRGLQYDNYCGETNRRMEYRHEECYGDSEDFHASNQKQRRHRRDDTLGVDKLCIDTESNQSNQRRRHHDAVDFMENYRRRSHHDDADFIENNQRQRHRHDDVDEIRIDIESNQRRVHPCDDSFDGASIDIEHRPASYHTKSHIRESPEGHRWHDRHGSDDEMHQSEVLDYTQHDHRDQHSPGHYSFDASDERGCGIEHETSQVGDATRHSLPVPQMKSSRRRNDRYHLQTNSDRLGRHSKMPLFEEDHIEVRDRNRDMIEARDDYAMKAREKVDTCQSNHKLSADFLDGDLEINQQAEFIDNDCRQRSYDKNDRRRPRRHRHRVGFESQRIG